MYVKLDFTIINDIKELEKYKDFWKAILRQNNNDNPYVEYEWVRYWWDYLGEGHTLFIIVMRLGSEIIGFCPLMLTKRIIFSEVNFIGYLKASYADIVVYDEYRKVAIGTLIDYLTNIKQKYIFNLHGLSEEGINFKAIQDYFNNRRKQVIVCQLQSRFIDTSNGDFESFYKQRRTHGSIKNIEKYERKLAKIGSLTYKRLDESNFDQIFDIHNKRWHKKNDGSSFSKGKTKEFYRKIALDGSLPFCAKVDGLFLDERLIAFKYCIAHNKRLINMRVAHDDIFAIYGPGKIIYKEKIKECFKEDIDICEFGTGGFQQDKANWTDSYEIINRIVFPTANITSRLTFIIYMVLETLRGTLRKDSRIVYFKRNTLGAIKYYLSINTYRNFIKTLLDAEKPKSLNAFTAKFFKSYYYYKHDEGFDIYKKRLVDLKSFQCDGQYSIKYSNVNDIDKIMEIMHLKAAEVLRRLERDNKCAVLLKENEIIAWAWINDKKLCTKRGTGIRALDAGEICIFDCWLPSYSKNVEQHRIAMEGYCYSFLKMGIEYIYIAVEKHDKSLLKAVKNMCFTKYPEA